VKLSEAIFNAALAFRGYNVTNLGRSPELLEHPVYGPVVADHLAAASEVCARVTRRPVDLVSMVRQRRETSLDTYAEAIGMIVAIEQAQLQLLQDCFAIDYRQARMSYGFSLGEISALVAGGVIDMGEALRVPLTMAEDCVELARDTTLGVLFSRGAALPVDEIERLCLRVNNRGQGVIGISAILSPNSVLVMGTGSSLQILADRIQQVQEALPAGVHLRRNESHWPPLHTPIMWERSIPNRSAAMMHTLRGGFVAPRPPVCSLVTGTFSYDDHNARQILARWVDHPQRLWDVVYETLARGIDTVVHVGPQPNIIPATFHRLAVDVESQTRHSVSMRALSAVIRRPWLQSLLPKRAALLRAPRIQQVNLEDWLLAHDPARPEADGDATA